MAYTTWVACPFPDKLVQHSPLPKNVPSTAAPNKDSSMMLFSPLWAPHQLHGLFESSWEERPNHVWLECSPTSSSPSPTPLLLSAAAAPWPSSSFMNCRKQEPGFVWVEIDLESTKDGQETSELRAIWGFIHRVTFSSVPFKYRSMEELWESRRRAIPIASLRDGDEAFHFTDKEWGLEFWVTN